MKDFTPIRATKDTILATPIKEGQFFIATDTGDIFLDVSDSSRIQTGNAIWQTPKITAIQFLNADESTAEAYSKANKTTLTIYPD